MPVLEDFFKEIDARWGVSAPGRIRLRVIGSSALMLQTGFARGTKDSDVLETNALTDDVKARLLALAGRGTAMNDRHGIYLDIVSRGLPFLPQVPLCHSLADLNRGLKCFELEVLDVVDVVVSKLKRFHANDASDVRAMVDAGRVDHARLLERFRLAVDVFSYDARADDLPRYVRNLHRVERDFLDVPESEIELPDWIG